MRGLPIALLPPRMPYEITTGRIAHSADRVAELLNRSSARRDEDTI